MLAKNIICSVEHPAKCRVDQGEIIEQAISGLQETTKLYLEEFPLSESSPRYITTMNVMSNTNYVTFVNN